MAKDVYWFPHDYNARRDPKLVKLHMKLGHEGKGLYWDLIEMMYEEGGYLRLSECESYAYEMRTHVDKIASVIRDFDLFKTEGDHFFSSAVIDRLEQKNAKSQKAKASAKARWDKVKEESKRNAKALTDDANASENDANASKESERNANASENDAKRREEKTGEKKTGENKTKEVIILGETSSPVPTTINKFDLFIKDFNIITGKKIRVAQDKFKRQYNKLLKDYSAKEIMQAVQNCKMDSYHQQNPQFLTPEFITRPDKFEKYFNANQVQPQEKPNTGQMQAHLNQSKRVAERLGIVIPESNGNN